MINRRKIIGAAGAGAFASPMVLAPLSAFAQQPPTKVWRVGFLTPGATASAVTRRAALRSGLRALGYVEGTNLVIDFRAAEGKRERLAELAAELMALKPDVLVTTTNYSGEALKRATSSIPIVMAASAAPVETGLIASLARPGGNLTGLTLMSSDIAGKWLQMARELRPGARRVGVMINSFIQGKSPLLEALELNARQIKVELIVPPIKEAADIPGALAQMRREGAQALIVQLNPVNYDQRALIVETAAQQKLPAVYENSDFVDLGGLVSYGANFIDMFRQSATYIDKIFKGAKPGDLPMVQPTTFEFVVNLKTAKALGIKLTQSMLIQATRVIE